jgi:hypothetical protein
MNQSLAFALIVCLAATVLLETGFFLAIGKRGKKDLLLVALVNVITNPVVVLLYWTAAVYTDWNTLVVLIPLELFAIVTEGYYYKRYGRGFRRPYLFSIFANMFSYGIGALVQSFF